MTLSKKLLDEITAYCELNELELNDFIEQITAVGFNISKYGLTPKENTPIKDEKVVFKELKEEKPITTPEEVKTPPKGVYQSNRRDIYDED